MCYSKSNKGYLTLSEVRRALHEIDDRSDKGYDGMSLKVCNNDSMMRKALQRRLSGEDLVWRITKGRRGAVRARDRKDLGILRAVEDLKAILNKRGDNGRD